MIMFDFNAILDWLNKNQGVPQWITALVAVAALFYTIREFFMKRRPYIDIELAVAENPNKKDGGWVFFARLINKGTYPGIVRVAKTEMRIGDEKYPSSVDSKMIISPGESKKSALIGSIYESGIKKILGHEYRNNRAELEVEVKSGSIGSNKLDYTTKVIYEVLVSGDRPEFKLIEEYFD